MPDLSTRTLQALGRTDATTPEIHGPIVLERLTYPESHPQQPAVVIEHVQFTRRQYLFALAYRTALNFERACLEAGLSREAALRFLRRPETQAWMHSRDKMARAKREWSAEDTWYAEGDKLFRERVVPKHRIQIWQEFGERSVPKPSRNGDKAPPQVVIQINPDSVKEFKSRQAAIDAEIVS